MMVLVLVHWSRVLGFVFGRGCNLDFSGVSLYDYLWDDIIARMRNRLT